MYCSTQETFLLIIVIKCGKHFLKQFLKHICHILFQKWPDTNIFLLRDEGCSFCTVFKESKLDLTKTECGRTDDQQQEDKYITASNLRNRPLTAAQLEASLNSTNETPAFLPEIQRHGTNKK